MPSSFTRQQLINGLLLEITRAQAGFQTMQLDAWRALAPEMGLLAGERVAGLDSIELCLHLKPYQPSWPQRLWRWITGQPSDESFELTHGDDPHAIRMTVRAAKGAQGYATQLEETRPPSPTEPLKDTP